MLTSICLFLSFIIKHVVDFEILYFVCFVVGKVFATCPFFCKKLLRISFLKYCSKWELKVAKQSYVRGLHIKTVSITVDDLGEQKKFNI